MNGTSRLHQRKPATNYRRHVRRCLQNRFDCQARLCGQVFTRIFLPIIVGGGCWFFQTDVVARPLRIEIEHQFGGEPLRFDEVIYETTTENRLSITRLDYLLSELSLQKSDGTWLESEHWFGFLSAGNDRNEVTLQDAPSGKFQAIRFQVGLKPIVNLSNPNVRPASHPLHPQLCGLHWSRQTGYIFLALEGRYREKDDSLGGFSFHVANDENRMKVLLPVEFDTQKHATISLRLDVKKIFSAVHPIDLLTMGNSTHSRPGDTLAEKLKTNIEQSFSVHEVRAGLFHPMQTKATSNISLPPGTTPYPLRISERLPRAKIMENNPLTVEGVALGEKLFHDPQLSMDNVQACSNCHHAEHAFSDGGRRFSEGASGATGHRNAMPLFNLIWHNHFFWDGRVDTLVEQVVQPIENPLEMNEDLDRVIAKLAADDSYPDLFTQAFGSSGITSNRLGQALAQFLVSKISQDSKYDRALDEQVEFTEEEKRGFQLFVTEHDPKRNLYGGDCFHCHGGSLFASQDFANNGLETEFSDQGRFLVTGKAADRGKFKVPSLRNVEVTGPYMHDGRFSTLEEVIEHYNSGVKNSSTLDPNLAKHPPEGLNLSDQDKKAMLAFLLTLTDESLQEKNEIAKPVSHAEKSLHDF